MAAPNRGSSTSETQIEVLWNALTLPAELRGAPIVSYHLQWDQSSSGSTWYDLTGLTINYLSTSFIVTTGVTPGLTYQFRVRAKNAYGFGVYSTATSIKASDKPDVMTQVTVAIQSGTYVRVSWIKPDENSDTID